MTIVALMLAAVMCTSANATTILFSFAGDGNGPSYTDTSKTYNSPNSYTVLAQAVDCTSSTSGCSAQTIDGTANGLGILGTSTNNNGVGLNEVANNDYIVLDFANTTTPSNPGGIPSSILSKATSVSITLYETGKGTASVANIYGMNTDPATTLLGTGSISSSTSITGISLNQTIDKSLGTFTLSSSGAYNYYVIDVTNADCGLVVTNASLNFTPAPEPGTFVMGGMALLGLGMAMKKRSRKV